MYFSETTLPGVFTIQLNPIKDERGFFARSFCKKEFEDYGLHSEFVQFNISYNNKKGTLRGLHYQLPPYEEVKIVSCRKGAIFDVVVDIRKDSINYGKWIAIELNSKDYKYLYIPKGFAHGFQTLCDDVELFYLMGNYYTPQVAKGIRWDDPFLKINWPDKNVILSDSDKHLPGFIP